MAPIATTFSWRDQRPHMRPFLVGQIAGITQQASVVTPAILVRPHRRPPESGRSLESQTVPMNQIVLGRALRIEAIDMRHDYGELRYNGGRSDRRHLSQCDLHNARRNRMDYFSPPGKQKRAKGV